jgi:hypothetical protein
MKKKINSLTAGGQTRPEIFPGDIFKDNRGERVTVKMITDNRITYIREGYSGECVFPVERFEREFLPCQYAPSLPASVGSHQDELRPHYE